MQGSILTTLGLSKIASATPLDQLKITEFAVGDGNGGYPTLDPSMTALTNEVWRGLASPPIRDPINPTILIFEVTIPGSAGGFAVREAAIFDEDGDMIAIGHTALAEKPTSEVTSAMTLIVRMRIALASTEQIDLIAQDGGGFDHQGLSNRSATGAHPASAISVTPVVDVMTSTDAQSALAEANAFDDSETYLNAQSKESAIKSLGRNYIFVNEVLGHKIEFGASFDDCDKFDEIFGRIHDGVDAIGEAAIVEEINNKLGILAQ